MFSTKEKKKEKNSVLKGKGIKELVYFKILQLHSRYEETQCFRSLI
jgi:hypothetical protein